MKYDNFIQELFTLTANYDGDGNGLCGDTHEEVVEILKKEYSTLFEIYKMLGGEQEKMKIKCPYCGSEEYEIYDTCGGNGENIQELYLCFNCGDQFSAIYIVDCVTGES